MSYALPTVPAGANPWAVYRETLDSGFFNSPSGGFKVRTYILWALLLYCAVAAITYSVLLVIDHRRKQKTLWVWKVVNRPSGGYIALNQHVLLSFFSIATSLALFGYVYTEYDLFVNQVSPNTSLLYRTWVWVPVWLQGYLVVSASLQAYIITSEGVEDGGHTISAPVANAIFLGVGGIILAETIIACSLCTWRWKSFYAAYTALRSSLIQAEGEWTGSLDFTKIAGVTAQYTALAEAYAPFFKTQQAVTWSYVAAPFTLVLLTFGAIRLIFALRRQIAYSLRRQNMATVSAPATVSQVSQAPSGKLSLNVQSDSYLSPNTPHSSTFPPGSPSSQKYAFDSSDSKASGMTDNSGFSHAPTSSGHTHIMKKHGGAPALSKTQTEREKTLNSLRRAEAELVIVATAAVFLATAFTAISIWTAIAALSIVIKWEPLEATVFVVPWAWSVVVAIALTLLCRHAIKSLMWKAPVISVSAPPSSTKKNSSYPPAINMTTFSPDFKEPDSRPAATTLHINPEESVIDHDYWRTQQQQWERHV